MSWHLSSPKSRVRAAVIVVIVLIVFFIVISAWEALVPFFIGILLAYLLLPAVNYLDQHAPKIMRSRGMSRPIAIIIVYVVLIAFAAGLISYFVPAIGGQAQTLMEGVPGYIEKVQNLVQYDVPSLLENIPPDIQSAVQANLEKAAGTLVDALQRGLVVTITTLSQTISFIIGLVIIPFWLFYVLNDEEKGRRVFTRMMPAEVRGDVRAIARLIDRILSRYIRGQFLLCLLVGGMATIALFALGVNLALLLGTIAGIFEIIPFLGPYLGAIPAVLVALANRPITALWVAVSFAAIQQIENIFLVPRISGNAVRFHPAIVMVIVVVGSELAGLLGVLLAVPVAAVVRDVLRYLYLRTTDAGNTPDKAFALIFQDVSDEAEAST
jgi:predicted PurR-regulated permease PerM